MASRSDDCDCQALENPKDALHKSLKEAVVLSDVKSDTFYIDNNHFITFNENSDCDICGRTVTRSVCFYQNKYFSLFGPTTCEFRPAKINHEAKIIGVYLGHLYESPELGNFILFSGEANNMIDKNYGQAIKSSFSIECNLSVVYFDTPLRLPAGDKKHMDKSICRAEKAKGSHIFELQNGQNIYCLKDENDKIVIINNCGGIVPYTELTFTDEIQTRDGDIIKYTFENDNILLIIGYTFSYLKFVNKAAGRHTKPAVKSI